MADDIKAMIISGYIGTKGKALHPDVAKKFASDLVALADLYGFEFIGSIVMRTTADYSTIDLYRHGASQQGSASVGNSPRADTPAEAAPAPPTAAGVRAAASPPMRHKHYHVHTDGLHPDVVKVTHEHWHEHDDVLNHFHPYNHLSFGVGPVSATAGAQHEEWKPPVDDNRFLTEHAKTCKACQGCDACREGAAHTHIT